MLVIVRLQFTVALWTWRQVKQFLQANSNVQHLKTALGALHTAHGGRRARAQVVSAGRVGVGLTKPSDVNFLEPAPKPSGPPHASADSQAIKPHSSEGGLAHAAKSMSKGTDGAEASAVLANAGQALAEVDAATKAWVLSNGTEPRADAGVHTLDHTVPD